MCIYCPKQNALLYSSDTAPIQLRYRIGLCENYYNTPADITHYFSSDVGFTNLVVQSTGQPCVEAKYGVPTVGLRGQ